MLTPALVMDTVVESHRLGLLVKPIVYSSYKSDVYNPPGSVLKHDCQHDDQSMNNL